MNSKTKTILLVIIIFLLPILCGTGLFIWYKKKKSTDESNVVSDESEDTSISSSTSSATTNKTTNSNKETNNSFPLKRNASVKSEKVKELQKLLNERIVGLTVPSVPYYNGKPITSLKEDGYYGDKTAAVVKYVFNSTNGDIVSEEMFNELESGTSYYLF